MHQGQLCKIQVHSGCAPEYSLPDGGGWFLKLSLGGNKQTFHLVDANRLIELSIPASLVDESMSNLHPERPYYVAFVVPSELQPVVTSVSPELDKLATQACIDARIKALGSTLNVIQKRVDEAKKKVELFEKEAQCANQRAGDLLQISSMPNPHFVYAYGKHPTSNREFCWRVPYALYNSVRVGSNVIVETQKGEGSAMVTRIEKSPYLLEHRLVISVG